jgi:FMN phosphatase YigB (HAD superfamily)
MTLRAIFFDLGGVILQTEYEARDIVLRDSAQAKENPNR